MFKEELINPIIKRDLGQCPICGNPLKVVTYIVERSDLNDSGMPISISTDIEYDAAACTRCGSTYYDQYTSEVDEPVIYRDGFGFMVVKDLEIRKWLDREFLKETPEVGLYTGLPFNTNPFSK